MDPVDSIEAEQERRVAFVKDPSLAVTLMPASLPVPASLSVDPITTSRNKQDIQPAIDPVDPPTLVQRKKL